MVSPYGTGHFSLSPYVQINSEHLTILTFSSLSHPPIPPYQTSLLLRFQAPDQSQCCFELDRIDQNTTVVHQVYSS